jgi:UDP-glucose 4-epimerase
MRKYVVTGGAGFIGSALVRLLLEEGGGHVVVIDNLLTGREENLAEVAMKIELHRADVRYYDDIAPIIKGSDTVFHLAAIPSVPRSIEEPVPSHEVNIDGTFHVLRACVDGGVRRVVYAASSSAYGETDVLPKVETMAPHPVSPYALQKLVGEYYATVFHTSYGLDAVSLRFFNVYGPRQDPSSPYSGVISLFLRALIERRPPTIYGDGGQSRDFTFVEDVVALVLKAARADDVGGKVYNAGNGLHFTLNEVWEVLQSLEGVRLPVQYAPPRAGDVRHSLADVTAAVRDLGHRPMFTLEEGLRRTLEWQRRILAPVS